MHQGVLRSITRHVGIEACQIFRTCNASVPRPFCIAPAAAFRQSIVISAPEAPIGCGIARNGGVDCYRRGDRTITFRRFLYVTQH